MQNLYETLLIVTPDADEEAVNAVIGDLRVVVENDGGTVLQAGVWERRKLAYHVQGKSEGIYVLLYADGNSTLPAALKQRMKLDEAVIRSMVVRLEDLQEADVRAEIEAGDKAASEALIEKQKAAAERRHEREAEEQAMSLEEMVAAEEAEEPGESEEADAGAVGYDPGADGPLGSEPDAADADDADTDVADGDARSGSATDEAGGADDDSEADEDKEI